MVRNKVVIVGAGFVGATTAFSLMHQSVAEHIVLIDINEALLKSQVMDLQHCVQVLGYTDVCGGNYGDVADAGVVVITCGRNQAPGMTRLDLVQANAKIIRDVVTKVFEANPKAIVIMVTNPVDVLTRLAVSLFPDKGDQIMGSGTILDSMRLRFLLGQKLDINPKSVHAYIVGEHGDSELPLWSCAAIGGEKLSKHPRFDRAEFDKLFEQAKNAAYAIIEGKQATYYGIGAGAAHLVNTVLLNKRTILPVSHLMTDEYGLKDVCLSMPAVVGRKGIVERLKLDITPEEVELLGKSAQKLKGAFEGIRDKG